MAIYESGEDYLETILVLIKEKGEVRAVDVAAKLGYSKPSVSRAMGILRKNQLIVIDEIGHIFLTEYGMKEATRIYERHTNIALYFERILGVGRETALKDACKIEHDLSDESYGLMCKAIKE